MEVEKWSQGSEPRLNVVVESGDRNANDAVRFYNHVRNKFERSSKALNSLTFQKKIDCLPLAAADLFAYNVYRIETGGKPIGTSKKPTKSDNSYRGNMYHIRLDRGALDALHMQALSFIDRRGSGSGVSS
jgi:hypothetical protein